MKKCSNSHLQIVADPDPAYHFDADADPDSAYLFYADPGPDPTFQSDLDPDPLHCIFYSLQQWLSFRRYQTLLIRIWAYPSRECFLTLGIKTRLVDRFFHAEIRDNLLNGKQISVCIVTKGVDL